MYVVTNSNLFVMIDQKNAVEFLLKHGANVNAVDNDKDTPLHLISGYL